MCIRDRTSTGATSSLEIGATKAHKVVLCHKPDKRGGHEIEVSRSALPAHLAHGDTEGACVATGTTSTSTSTTTAAATTTSAPVTTTSKVKPKPKPKAKHKQQAKQSEGGSGKGNGQGNGNSGHQRGGGKK